MSARMQPVATVERFRAAPVGRYYVGRAWFVWCSAPRVAGSCLWGRLGRDDLVELAQFLSWRPASLDAPFDMISDASRVEALDPEGYSFAAQHFRGLLANLSPMVRRHAFVHRGGFLGAVMTGVLELSAPGHEWRAFEELEAAFGWLGQPGTLDELRLLTGAIVEGNEGLGALREFLRARRGKTSLGEAARAVARSQRSLQRDLKEAGSSFRLETARARVDAARALLLDSNLKIEAIAREVGCLSPGHFTRLFQRVAHETPSAYRARHRVASSGNNVA